jgi:hypothetical protein
MVNEPTLSPDLVCHRLGVLQRCAIAGFHKSAIFGAARRTCGLQPASRHAKSKPREINELLKPFAVELGSERLSQNA